MAPSPPTGAPAEVAGSVASYFKFDSRLDYYMQLAEESGLANDASSPDGEHQVQDTDMGESVPPVGSTLPPSAAHSRVNTTYEGGPGASPTTHSPMSTPRLVSPPARATPSLASRAGAFQVTPDGQRSYFGPTSYLHLLRGSSTLWNRLVKRARPSSLNRLLMPPEKRALEGRLINCFFTWDNLFLASFDSNLYLRDKARYESGQDACLYSPALGYAM